MKSQRTEKTLEEMIEEIDEYLTPLIQTLNENEGPALTHLKKIAGTYVIINLLRQYDELVSLGILEKSKQLYTEVQHNTSTRLDETNPLVI